MSPERWQRIKGILDRVAAVPADRREVRVREACGDDATLLSDVVSFLELEGDVDELIEEPLWSIKEKASEPEAPEAEDSGTHRRVGPYRIERLLGRGGMGAVYLALRWDDFEQRVALKLVSWGMDSDEILARFYNERQILADLQHPNVARLLDGGTTEDGMPYFAMEYVEGVPIDRYCEDEKLSVRARLELFDKVCAAVHFAHQNLVVHRDLKPSNILVTEEGEPKLLDFGIAKILQPELAARKLATVPGHGPMTPEYASPEQILNSAITTASDVYALGVLLYRLLTGLAPYRLRNKTYMEILNLICRSEPKRPSTVIGLEEQTVADTPTARASAAKSSRSPGDRRRLQRQLSGDLDAIVMKAMRKEPRHRYGSAVELADDLRRHQHGLPIRARQGTWLYVAGKFVKRHKLGLAMVLLVLGFAVTTTILWRLAVYGRAQAELQRERAESARAQASTVSGLLKEMITSVDPDQAQGEEITVHEVLDSGREKILRQLEGEPEIQAEMLAMLGNLYKKLGIHQESRESLEHAVRIRRDLYPDGHPLLATGISNLAALLHKIGDYEGAEKYFREALRMRRSLGQPDSKIDSTLMNLATTVMNQGRYQEAEELMQEVVEIRRTVYGENHSKLATSLYNIGTLHFSQGDLEDAEAHLRQALEIRTQALGPRKTKVAEILAALARVRRFQGQYGEARDLYEQALDVRTQLLGEDHVDVANTRKSLAALLLDLGEVKGAGTLLHQALGVLQEKHSADSWVIADAENVEGYFLSALGHYDEAEPLLIGSFETIRKSQGDDTIYTWDALQRILDLYRRWGRPEEEKKYRALADQIDSFGKWESKRR